jgi:hypothetical protein
METLALEHWIDIREAVQRRIKELSEVNASTPEARREQARKINSLNESYQRIEQQIKDLLFDDTQLPF